MQTPFIVICYQTDYLIPINCDNFLLNTNTERKRKTNKKIYHFQVGGKSLINIIKETELKMERKTKTKKENDVMVQWKKIINGLK